VRTFAVLLLIANLGFADTITFRDGHTVRGSFLGGDARSVRIAVDDRVETYALSEVTNIVFDGASPTATANPVPAPPPPRRETRSESRPVSRQADSREIPSGTVLTIRMVDSVDSERDNVGQTFRASLDEPVQDPSGYTVVPRGADVVVKLVDDKESGKLQGRTVLTLDLSSVRIDGRDVEIDTVAISQQSDSRTTKTAKMAGGGAALGAIIGAIAGGGKGAAIGAASGAGAGTAVQVMTKGQRVRIPSETRLTFTLQQPVRW
jgi:hypothetical protein